MAEPAGLGHLRTAWSSGSSSILVMEGEPPRLAEGDGVDDDGDDRPPFEEDLRITRILGDYDGVMPGSHYPFGKPQSM